MFPMTFLENNYRHMKKILIALAVSVGFCASVNAQDTAEKEKPAKEKPVKEKEVSASSLSFVSKNGHEVLPQEGDYCLGIGASGVLNYVGDMFGFTGNNSSASFNYAAKSLPSAVIYGKYFVSSDLAYRGSINITANNTINLYDVDDETSEDPDVKLQDKSTVQNGYVTVAAGLEKRKGQSRVQGVYGAEVFVNYNGGSNYVYEYANMITKVNQQPESTSFYDPFGGSSFSPSQGYRILNAKTGSSFSFGARAFAGVEYFFAPKMSVGGEFTWGVSVTNYGEKKVTYEGYEAETESVVGYTLTSKRGSAFNAGIGNVGGNINLLFYF